MARLKRRASGAWGARITIPKDVRPDYQALYNKSVEEIFHALPGCSPPRAQALFLRWQAGIKNRIAALRAKKRGEGRDLTQREAIALAGEWYRDYNAQHEDNPGRPDEWEVAWSLLADTATEASRYEGAIDAEFVREDCPFLAKEAAQFLADKGETLTPPATDLFLKALLHQAMEGAALLKRRAEGDYSPDQHLQTLPAYTPANTINTSDGVRTANGAKAATSRSGQTSAMRIFEAYISASNLATTTVQRRRPVFMALDDHLAKGPFDGLSDDDAQHWIASLVTKDRAAITVAKIYITPLRATGRWALKQRLITRNPFENVSIKVPRKTKHRETKAFRTEEIRIILSSASAIKNTKRPGMAARRWVPWICAYTGARAGEITQLRGEDVKERDGIKAIWITPEAGAGKTGEPRWVPIHTHLIELGFLDYVKSKGRGPLFYNPALLAQREKRPDGSITADITNPNDHPAATMRNVLGRWVRSLGIDDREVQPTHGWRHSFKQIADRHGISDRVSDAITGHAPPTEGRKYGAPTLEDMSEALKLFPRFEVG